MDDYDPSFFRNQRKTEKDFKINLVFKLNELIFRKILNKLLKKKLYFN